MTNTLTTLGCVAALMVVAGCHATGASQTAHDGSQTVVCSKCEMVWVESYDMNDPYMMTLVREEVMRCADCESAIAHFFRTGELRPYCASCGTALCCRETR